jgi:multidrug efflux pump subunit AcrA (membrane-fusion protein)
MKIDLTFAEHVGKTYQGTLVRTADAIDPASRTLLVEVDVDNRAGELLPGSLAQVHFKTPNLGQTFIVPVAALIFRRDGMSLGLVETGSDGTRAHVVPVIIGQDDGATAQIASGISANDQIIQDPPDSLIDGERVTVVNSGKASNAGGK